MTYRLGDLVGDLRLLGDLDLCGLRGERDPDFLPLRGDGDFFLLDLASGDFFLAEELLSLDFLASGDFFLVEELLSLDFTGDFALDVEALSFSDPSAAEDGAGLSGELGFGAGSLASAAGLLSGNGISALMTLGRIDMGFTTPIWLLEVKVTGLTSNTAETFLSVETGDSNTEDTFLSVETGDFLTSLRPDSGLLRATPGSSRGGGGGFSSGKGGCSGRLGGKGGAIGVLGGVFWSSSLGGWASSLWGGACSLVGESYGLVGESGSYASSVALETLSFLAAGSALSQRLFFLFGKKYTEYNNIYTQ